MISLSSTGTFESTKHWREGGWHGSVESYSVNLETGLPIDVVGDGWVGSSKHSDVTGLERSVEV